MKKWAPGGLFLLVLAYLIGCANESNQDSAMPNQGVDASTPVDMRVCSPIHSAQPLPALESAQSGTSPPTEKTVYVDDLYNLFASHCGGCHIDVGLGGYKTARASFSFTVDQSWVDSIYYNNEKVVMPPPSVGGVVAKKRAADDPVNELGVLMQAWVDAGRPKDMFQVEAAQAESSGAFSLDPDLAKALTNIGSCIPEKALYASEQAKMVAMDDKFFALVPMPSGKGTRQQQIGLPETLGETDLTSFDSRELAKMGVVSYAVTYPQWVGQDSQIMRHIRVPYGESITFDATSQQFVIPGNTRFYRTILQKVKDAGGNDRWRKIETQVIIAWPNVAGKAGYKAVASTAGTYLWNENESQATLLTDPYRSGIPFRDHTVTYVADEAKVSDILAKYPKDRAYALRKGHALRSYAVTGAYRCGQCHLGSSSNDFTLGFQPLQIVRRKLHEGGNIDSVGEDELSQLTRFIDWGLITGVTAADILPLEQSQGANTPRNDSELIAQGYMLGNCAHCHNKQGYANTLNPELTGVLDFYPSSTTGVFRFPLERYSPRITRGSNVPIPYITPSLLDIDKPDMSDEMLAFRDKRYKPKCDPTTVLCKYAPWRSLIYRGVDTPFAYSDDIALFPHMPTNTQSIDPRAAQIMGDWMVSIPGVLKNPNVAEYQIRTAVGGTGLFDSSPQPYREVKQGQTGYKAAVAAASERLYRYHNYPAISLTKWPNAWVYPTSGDQFPTEPAMPSRYQFSPDTFDIVDPLVVLDPADYPVPIDDPTGVVKDGILVMSQDNVPDHAHWVFFDPTQVPGDWGPRRPDWSDVFLNGKGTTTDAERFVVNLLNKTTLTPALKQLALTPLPIGLWKSKTDCDFSSELTVGDYKSTPPMWMLPVLAANSASTAPVYRKSPGEYVHDLVCANCHGVNADSSGRQAVTLSEMTGGRANVTDFIHGILVPSNRTKEFQSAPLTNATTEDWAARYFTWMGLGGTKQTIPDSILAVIANTSVFGEARRWTELPVDANMLSVAAHLCAAVLPYRDQMRDVSVKAPYAFEWSDPKQVTIPSESQVLMYDNGDAMLWGKICSVDNEAPIRALNASNWATFTGDFKLDFNSFYDATVFPAGSSIMNQRGEVVTVTSAGTLPPDAYFRLCVRKPGTQTELAAANLWLSAHLVPKAGKAGVVCATSPNDCTQMPFCPDKDKNGANYVGPWSANPDSSITTQLSGDQQQAWVTRGAINAGMVAYVYLTAMQNGDVGTTPDYDKCSQLSN